MKAHAVSLLVVSLVLHPCVGHAAWQLNGTGVAITSGDQGQPTICPDGAGGTIIAWADSRNGNYDIYAQRMDGLGVAKWGANGVLVCFALGDQTSPQIVPDGNNGAIVTWEDTRNGNPDIFAQRVDASGNSQWFLNGVVKNTAVTGRDNLAVGLDRDVVDLLKFIVIGGDDTVAVEAWVKVAVGGGDRYSCDDNGAEYQAREES